MRVVSLFSGIGGFETAFSEVGWKTILMCENDPLARSVLGARYPDVPISEDVTTLKALPDCDVIAAGWPCQDLSQAGRTAGISGSRSGLIEEVFRLIDAAPKKPSILLLENVAFALTLHKGAAIELVTEALEQRGYRWAYRVLDTQHFGLPQRRRRVFICASRTLNPSAVLFAPTPDQDAPVPSGDQVGFYWTEGNTGIGWTPNAVPPLKGGSAISIPSPPAIWNMADGKFCTPGIDDAERLQGFTSGWTDTGMDDRASHRGRWRLVGNAVSVPVVEWIARRISESPTNAHKPARTLKQTGRPNAAWGAPKGTPEHFWGAFEGPTQPKSITLTQFGLSSAQPLSHRAVRGFHGRYAKSKLKRNQLFLEHLAAYCEATKPSIPLQTDNDQVS
jgi:DNA (cytosine-5)-methyltransferase 1